MQRRLELDDTLHCIASFSLLASHRLARPRAKVAGFETAPEGVRSFLPLNELEVAARDLLQLGRDTLPLEGSLREAGLGEN